MTAFRFTNPRTGRRSLWAAGYLMALLVAGCGHPQAGPQETPTSGHISISVDESFKPVIDSEIKVFESSFPDAHISVEYKSEADCFRDLARDSTRLIIVTRGLNKAEEQYYQDSLSFIPIYGLLAYDAVAAVVPAGAKDTVATMDQIRALLEGQDPEKREVILDGLKATSTVRFVIDSVLHGASLGKNVVATRSSQQVLDSVIVRPNSVGFIGVSWIGDEEDSTQLGFLKKIKVVAVACDACEGKPYVVPAQYNILTKRYPMVRGLYYILKENFSGIGSNFVNFLQYERGQLIFKRAYLVPAKMSFDVRNVEMK